MQPNFHFPEWQSCSYVDIHWAYFWYNGVYIRKLDKLWTSALGDVSSSAATSITTKESKKQNNKQPKSLMLHLWSSSWTPHNVLESTCQNNMQCAGCVLLAQCCVIIGRHFLFGYHLVCAISNIHQMMSSYCLSLNLLQNTVYLAESILLLYETEADCRCENPRLDYVCKERQ